MRSGSIFFVFAVLSFLFYDLKAEEPKVEKKLILETDSGGNPWEFLGYTRDLGAEVTVFALFRVDRREGETEYHVLRSGVCQTRAQNLRFYGKGYEETRKALRGWPGGPVDELATDPKTEKLRGYTSSYPYEREPLLPEPMDEVHKGPGDR